ncbi:hypothetical protein GALMADRAFT_1163256 [Galerina marginata CBS 339.88]|uniref:Uncharacterized protein n=1 Tax=Galerina marginata (strain CBS 339.88) TaxID=685588 RepID=A0A067T9D9_GALM3|nr:hypothetical protein GALMADRAFT_1163256 [Galerina marginata CBS 339.88]
MGHGAATETATLKDPLNPDAGMAQDGRRGGCVPERRGKIGRPADDDDTTTVVAGIGLGRTTRCSGVGAKVEARSSNAMVDSVPVGAARRQRPPNDIEYSLTPLDLLNTGAEMVPMMDGGVEAARSGKARIGGPADERDADADVSGGGMGARCSGG